MKAHGVPVDRHNEWITPNGELPAIRATWFPGEQSGRLDVEVLIEEGRLVEECFAGIQGEQSAKQDAIENFCTNSLHVLLAALWGLNDTEQVTTEIWTIGKQRYTAYIGNFGTRGTIEAKPEVPEQLFETIERTIKREQLNQDYHWVRNFFCDIKGEPTYESLLDSEPWESGISALASLGWKKSNGYYSVRNFLVLKRN